MKNPETRTRTAFTLAELMVAIASGTILLAALLSASASLQRSFMAVEAYAISEGDQLRVQDYIAMDCRRASKIVIETGSWVNSGGTYKWVYDATKPQTLVTGLPGYYDGTTKTPVAPYFDGNGKLQYNTSLTWQQTLPDSTTVTNTGVPISYYKSGSTFIRQVGADPNAAKPLGLTVIATNVSTFTLTPFTQSVTNGTVVSCSITFAPSFTRLPGTAPIAGTTVYSSTFLRNAQAR